MRYAELAVEHDPQDADAYYQAGRAAHLLGQMDKAIADYKKFLELDPDSENARRLKESMPILR